MIDALSAETQIPLNASLKEPAAQPSSTCTPTVPEETETCTPAQAQQGSAAEDAMDDLALWDFYERRSSGLAHTSTTAGCV